MFADVLKMTWDEATQLHSAVDAPAETETPHITLSADEVDGRALAAIRRLTSTDQRVTRTDSHGLYELCADERRRDIANELDGISRADVRQAVKRLIERGAAAVAEDGSLALPTVDAAAADAAKALPSSAASSGSEAPSLKSQENPAAETQNQPRQRSR
jgi:hypothetical protein